MNNYHSPEFKYVRQYILSTIKNKELKKELEKVLIDEKIGGQDIYSNLTRDNPGISEKRPLGYAYLLLTSPETYKFIKDSDARWFHGTDGSAIPDITEHGLTSHKTSIAENREVKTGEKWSRGYTGLRGFVSATDDPLTALDYASMYNGKYREK